MFSKDNIKSIRFSNPQNDTVEVTYWDKDNQDNPLVKYWFSVLPYNSVEWKTVREAGYDLDSIYRNTLKWIAQQEKYLEIKKQKKIIAKPTLAKINYELLPNEGNETVIKLAPVTIEKDYLNIFITKSNNPNAPLQSLSIRRDAINQKIFLNPTQEKFSVYMVQ